jgi:hypothetical protein
MSWGLIAQIAVLAILASFVAGHIIDTYYESKARLLEHYIEIVNRGDARDGEEFKRFLYGRRSRKRSTSKEEPGEIT